MNLNDQDNGDDVFDDELVGIPLENIEEHDGINNLVENEYDEHNDDEREYIEDGPRPNNNDRNGIGLNKIYTFYLCK